MAAGPNVRAVTVLLQPNVMYTGITLGKTLVVKRGRSKRMSCLPRRTFAPVRLWPGTLMGGRTCKASDRRLVRLTLRGALLGLEIGTSRATLPVGDGRFVRTPHIALSGAFLTFRASDCNGWLRRWVPGGRRDGTPEEPVGFRRKPEPEWWYATASAPSHCLRSQCALTSKRRARGPAKCAWERQVQAGGSPSLAELNASN